MSVALLVFPASDDAGGLIDEHLVTAGWSVEIVATATAALMRLVRPPAHAAMIELLIVSSALPGMPPERLARAARSAPGCARLALVVVGTDSTGLDRAKAVRADDPSALAAALSELFPRVVAASRDPDLDLLDAEAVRMLKDVPGLWDRAVATLVQELPPRIAALDGLIAVADLPEVHRIAHALKGSVGSLGCRELSALLGRLENAAHAGDRQQVEALRPDIRPLAERTLAVLHRGAL